jgi:hypothetical protein
MIAPATKKTGPGPEEQFFSSDVINSSATIPAGGLNGSYYRVITTTAANGSTVQVVPGNLGRNTYRTNGFSNVDFSVLKDTQVTEHAKLQFRAEFFNLLKHAFGIHPATLTETGFGVASSTVLPGREIQFGLKLLF